MGEGLKPVLKRSSLIVSVGSGGVGKTTTAAALAIAAARDGKRAAVLTIDPARRLAQALGIDKMGNTPSRLPDALTGPGIVDAMMLETAECFDDLIARLVPDETRQERLLQNRLYQVLARHLGGTHEYMAVEKLFALTSSGEYDLVILDTPPSVNALDFLDAPERLASFFSEKVTRFFVRSAEEEAQKKGFFARMKDRAGDMAVTVLGKALGEVFMDDVRDFATAFQGLFAAFRERGTVINSLMADPGTSFLVVSGADPVRVSEALEFVHTLRKFHIRPRAFIANRVHLPLDVEALTEDATQKALKKLNHASNEEVHVIHDDLLQARGFRSALARRDAAGLEILRREARTQVHVVPELEDEVADRAAVEHVIAALIGERED